MLYIMNSNNPFSYVRSIISEEIHGLSSFRDSGFDFVDECRDVMALALARNKGTIISRSESDSDDISMTFIDFFVSGLEGEGETLRARDWFAKVFRGDTST
jgi:hypothetical protein